MATGNKKISMKERTFDSRADTLDFRDKMYEPTLVEVPTQIPLEQYQKAKVPILDQGREGACTGFGLTTVAHYLLRTRHVVKDVNAVSPRMFYEMAKRYDEWEGDDYSGSSARGGMKGWHKHGVCSSKLWAYKAGKNAPRLTNNRAQDAAKRPLGAYFRVNHKDLVAMHSAIAEVGVLYATASVHAGWDKVDGTGLIPFEEGNEGGHAFAIVAFDERGFWIQNSWSATWGNGGFGLISYDDWLANGTDVWVARLGAPVSLRTAKTATSSQSLAGAQGVVHSYNELRPHVISLGNDGRLKESGTYGTSATDVKEIFIHDFPRLTEKWTTKRILLYAHGGLVSEATALDRLAQLRTHLLDAEIYPLSFLWHADLWSTLTDILQDAGRSRRPEGFLDAAKDFLLDRLDDTLEPVARTIGGKALWDEMRENALRATTEESGGARFTLSLLKDLAAANPGLEVHIAGHSAGCIFHGPLVHRLTNDLGLKVASCTLWAPACTIDLFKQNYLPAVNSRAIERFALFTLKEGVEQDDSCNLGKVPLYFKSLLYLVSNALEQRRRTPLLGMEESVKDDSDLKQLFKSGKADWVKANNEEQSGSKGASTARHHGDFDDDIPTLRATLARILNKDAVKVDLKFSRSAAGLKDMRQSLMTPNDSQR